MIDYVKEIKESNSTIYDIDRSPLIPNKELELILNQALCGISLAGIAVKTRSKYVKHLVCTALGYPTPKTFKRTRPRFPAQSFDVHTQSSNNLQIWNEDIVSDRRYVLVRPNRDGIITQVRVVTGEFVNTLNRTGTLTQKYQARMRPQDDSRLFSPTDTTAIEKWASSHADLSKVKPNDDPSRKTLLPAQIMYRRLLPLVGQEIPFIDAINERNRGYELHKIVCKYLGYRSFEDDGTYPDIRNQLAEIKLQTSNTIDLGLHSPEDGQPICQVNDKSFFSSDIRYIIVEGKVNKAKTVVKLKRLYLLNGKDFTAYFPLFKGSNKKLQLPLPSGFFHD